MKKAIKLGVVFLSCLALSSCIHLDSDNETTTETTIRNTNLDDILTLSEKELNVHIDSKNPFSKLNVYKFNENNIYYSELEEFFNLYEPLYQKIYKDNNCNITVSKDVLNEVKITRENGSYVLIDAAKNTITFSDYDLFVTPSFSTPNSFLPDYGDLGTTEDSNIKFVANSLKGEAKSEGSSSVTFNFSDYNIKTVIYEDNIYLPFNTLSDLFTTFLYAPLTVYDEFIYSPYLSSSYEYLLDYNYSLKLTSEVIDYSYNEIAFNLDFNYGLEENKNNLLEEYNKDTLSELFLSLYRNGDENTLGNMQLDLGNMLYSTLDDPHCYSLSLSNLSSILDIMQFYNGLLSGERNIELSIARSILMTERDQNGFEPGYYEIDDTAVISFEQFDELLDDTYTDKERILNDEYNLTYNAGYLFYYAYNKITRKDSPIKNIIIDESYNGGGDTRCGTFIAGMFCDYVENVNKNKTGSGTGLGYSYYESDCNLDGVINDEDKLISKGDYNIYCLTSDSSFSCANYLPHALKDNNPNIKIIGEKSAGGECAILPCVTPYGFCYSISGPLAILMKDDDGTYMTSDHGVPVDYELEKSVYGNMNSLVNAVKKF